jgi:Protein of unknown function (DUF664)
MAVADVLVDAFSRIHESVHEATEGLSRDDLLLRVDRAANPIGWLVWHLTRVEDDHIADAAGIEQVWTSQGWAGRFGLPYDTSAHGYGQSSDEVGEFQVKSAERFGSSKGSPMPTSSGSSTSAGTRRSPSVSGW